jgi:hypothetical protein
MGGYPQVSSDVPIPMNVKYLTTNGEKLTVKVKAKNRKEAVDVAKSKDPNFKAEIKTDFIYDKDGNKLVNEERTSTVSKSRAKSELKQMLQGYRDDDPDAKFTSGKSTLKAVLAIDKDGKETKINKLEDFSKFEKGTKFAIKETTMKNDRLTELIKAALKVPVKEEIPSAEDRATRIHYGLDRGAPDPKSPHFD